METITTIGPDLTKPVFQVHAITRDGRVIVRRALRRSRVLDFFRGLQPCLVALGGICQRTSLGQRDRPVHPRPATPPR